MERMKMTDLPETQTSTISDTLDRLEALVGRIGFNTPDQALALLNGLDEVTVRLEGQENTLTYKSAEAQLEGIFGRLRADAGGFLRDLGGAQALAAHREKARPSQENWWWYLDEYLADKRRRTLRRALTALGTLAVVLAVLAVVYQVFLAPDEVTSAVYQAENISREKMAAGNFEQALAEVENGLRYSPQNPVLLTTKGVILESMGQEAQAAQVFDQAEQFSLDREEFLINRGQAYVTVNQLDKALADAQEVIRLNPDSAQGHLLAGSVLEYQGKFTEALKEYDVAFEAATASDQSELAALVRYRTAMLMQSMNMQLITPEALYTPTP